MNRRLRGALLHLNSAGAAFSNANLETPGPHGREQWESGAQAVAIVTALEAVQPRDAATTFFQLPRLTDLQQQDLALGRP